VNDTTRVKKKKKELDAVYAKTYARYSSAYFSWIVNVINASNSARPLQDDVLAPMWQTLCSTMITEENKSQPNLTKHYGNAQILIQWMLLQNLLPELYRCGFIFLCKKLIYFLISYYSC